MGERIPDERKVEREERKHVESKEHRELRRASGVDSKLKKRLHQLTSHSTTPLQI